MAQSFLSRGIAALALLFAPLFALGAIPVEAQRGLSWLSAQVQGNGAVTGETSSVGTAFQSRAEAAHALRQFSSAPASLIDAVGAETDDAVEYLARKAIVLAIAGRDASGVLQALAAHQNDDGGFGAAAGYESSALDTAYALIAFKSASYNAPAAIDRAIAWLGGDVQPDGGFGFSGQSAAYPTSLALFALAAHANGRNVTTLVDRAQGWLAAAAPSGTFVSTVDNASVALALSAVSTDANLIAPLQATLKSRQLPDHSWGGDPYLTGLVVRALIAAAEAGPASTTGQISGTVLDDRTNQPLAGVAVQVSGTQSASATTDAAGIFLVAGLDPGSYTVQVSKPGYGIASGVATVTAGSLSNLGTVRLVPASTTAILQGSVRDGATGLALAGAAVSVTDSGSATTDATGGYQIADILPGMRTITVSRAGYDTLTLPSDFQAGVTTLFAPALYPSGSSPGSATLTGRVVSAQSQQPIGAATVRVASAAASTDAQGYFTLANLAIGQSTIEVSAAGHRAQSYTATLGGGVNNIGAVALESLPAAFKVSGRVSENGTSLPVGGATVRLQGTTLSAVTGPDGRYEIAGLSVTSFTLAVSASGFLSRNVNVTLAAPGDAVVDVNLDKAQASSLQMLAVTTGAAYDPYTAIEIDAQIQNNGATSVELMVSATIFGPGGAVALEIPPRYGMVPAGAPLTFELEGHITDQLPGAYNIEVRGADLGGNTLVEGTASMAVNAITRVAAGITPNPPLAQAGIEQSVALAASLYNHGNVEVPAGNAELTVTFDVPDPGYVPKAQTILDPRLIGAPLNQPKGIANGDLGSLFVLNGGDRKILKLVADGQTTEYCTLPSNVGVVPIYPEALVREASGTIYVLNNNSVILQVAPLAAPVATCPVSVIPVGRTNLIAFDLEAGGNFVVIDRQVHPHYRLNRVLRDGGTEPLLTNGLSSPVGVVRAPDGNLYVTSSTDGQLVRVGPDGRITEFATGLKSPQGVAVDPAGNFYVVNAGDNSIVKVTATGQLLSPPYATGLSSPYDVKIDAAGNLFVSNTGDDTILRIVPGSPAQVQVFAQSVASSPQGMAYDAAGNLHVAGGLATSGYYVSRLSATEEITRTSLGSGSVRGVATSPSGEVFVAQFSSNSITKVGQPGAFATGLASPTGLAHDGAGTLYVAESSLRRITAVPVANPAVKSVVLESAVNAPRDLRLGTGGDRYLLNASTIVHVPPAGAARVLASLPTNALSFTRAANGDFYYSENGGIRRVQAGTGTVTLLRSGLGYPAYGMSTDAAGNVIMVEYSGRRMLSLHPTDTTLAPTVLGTFPETVGSWVADGAGGYFVSYLSGRLVHATHSGAGFSETLLRTGVYSVQSLAVDPGVRLYFTTGGGVSYLDLQSNALVSNWIAQSAAQAIAVGGGQVHLGLYNENELVTYDMAPQVVARIAGFDAINALSWASGEILFCDYRKAYAVTPGGNPRVLAPASYCNAIASQGGKVYVGQTSQVGVITPGPGAVTQTYFTHPGVNYFYGIAFKPDGTMAVGTNDHRILVVNAAKQVIASYAGVEQPKGIELDAAGNVYVSSLRARQVNRFDPSGKQSVVLASFADFNNLGFIGGQLHGTTANRLVRIESNGAQTQVAVTPTAGSTLAGFASSGAATYVIDKGTSIVRALAGTGLPGYAAGLGIVSAMKVGPGGAIFLGSSSNGTISKFSNGELDLVAADLGAVQALGFQGASARLFAGSGSGFVYDVDTAAGTTTEFANTGDVIGAASAITSLAVGAGDELNAVFGQRIEVHRIARIAAPAVPPAGTVIYSAVRPFPKLPVGPGAVDLDFGSFVPPFGGDYRIVVKPLAGGVSGMSVNMLHVGPHADATMSAATTLVPPGDSPVAVTVRVEGADFTSIAKTDATRISAPQLTSHYLTAMGALANGKLLFLSNGTNQVMERVGQDPATPYHTLASPAPISLQMRGAIPVDDDQNIYLGVTQSYNTRYIVRVSPDRQETVLASIPSNENIVSLARNSRNDIFVLTSARIYRIPGTAVPGSTPEIFGVASGGYAMTVDGRDNLYVQFYGSLITRYGTDGTVTSILRPGANGEPTFEYEGMNIAGDCADNLFLTPFTWRDHGQIGEEYSLIQMVGRSGQVAQILDGRKSSPQLTDMDFIVFDRFSGTLLIWTDVGAGLVYRVPVTCGAISTNLHVVFPAGQATGGFSVTPSASSVRADGSREFVWSLKDVTSLGKAVRFETTLANLALGSVRPVAKEAFLTFQNSFVPGELRRAIPVPSVGVDSLVDLAAATDRPAYPANAEVLGTVTLGNRSVQGRAGVLTVEVTDAQGVQLSRLLQQDVTLTANGQLAVSAGFNTGATLTGTYSLRGSVTDAATGVELANGKTSFDIVVEGARLTSSVATDSPAYDPFDQVLVLGRAKNLSVNAIAGSITVKETVRAPSGAVIFSGSQTIAQLVPGAFKDMPFAVRLNGAAPGTYTVEQLVTDAAGFSETRVANFAVLSSIDTGTGLRGAIAVQKKVNAGDPATLAGTARNDGNADLPGVVLTLKVVNPGTAQVVQQWSASMPIARGEQQSISRSWDTTGIAAGTYSGVATATVAGREITLAQDTILVGVLQPFAFAPRTSVERSVVVESEAVAIAGIVAGATVGIAGGEYRIGTGAWTTAAGTVNAGDTVQVRQASSASYNTPTTATLSVGAFNAGFRVTTVDPDVTPDAFAFTPQTGLPPSTLSTSNTVTITGIDIPVPISILGGEYAINGGAWTSLPGFIASGGTVAVRLMSAATAGATTTATLTVSTASAAFSVTTTAEDRTPEPFTFVDRMNVTLNAQHTSSAITVLGITVPVPIKVTGGEYSIDGGAFTAADGTVASGAVVTVRQTSSSSFATTTTATLTVSEVSAPFRVTTKAVADLSTLPAFNGAARVLVFVACKDADAPDERCSTQRRTFLGQYLAELGIEHRIVEDVHSFQAELRSGRYNTYWFAGGTTKLKDDVDQEVREAAFRGESVIVDGLHDERNGFLDEIVGIAYRGKPSQLTTVTHSAAYLPAGSFVPAGGGIRVELTTGRQDAAFNTGDPAVASNTYGYGRGLLFAFDLTGTLFAQSASALLRQTVTGSLGFIVPEAPATVTGGAYVPLAITLRNPEPVAVDVKVSVSLPAGFTLLTSDPSATVVGNQVTWTAGIPAASTEVLEWVLRASEVTGTYTLPVEVMQLYGGSQVPVGSYPIAVEVKGADTQLDKAIADLGALALSANRETKARDEAIEALREARLRIGVAAYEDAIEKLLAAGATLDDVTSVDVAPIVAAIDQVMKEVQRRWWSALPPCPASAQCRTPN